MITVYGIKNCDSVKKALKWLDSHDHEYRFHDFRVNGLDAKLLQSWINRLGWELLLNKRGTTWRQLPETLKRDICENAALEIMLKHPAVIKRPILVTGETLLVGFNEAEYIQRLV
jgi:Spx/MgsR family transcriptional regulator